MDNNIYIEKKPMSIQDIIGFVEAEDILTDNLYGIPKCLPT